MTLLSAASILAPFAYAESLHGRIVDRASLESSAGGKGVAAARITLYDAAGRNLKTKATAKSGAYRFPKLAPGTYTLSIAAKDHLPATLLRIVTIGKDDTLSRDFSLDRVPMRGGVPVRAAGTGNGPGSAYYSRLAEGILEESRLPRFHRETVTGHITLSRFYDADDTTEAYRILMAGLAWAEIPAQGRPAAAELYLAHAYDSALQAASLPTLPALKPYLKVSPDSVEALALSIRKMLLSPTRKDRPETLIKRKVPKAWVVRLLEEQFRSKSAPKPRKKAYLAKIRSLIGPEAARRLALLADPPRTKAKAKTKSGQGKAKSGKGSQDPENGRPPGPPAPDREALWKVVQELAAGRDANPVAVHHLALRRYEQGRAREALAELGRLESLRPDYPRGIHLSALCRLASGDTSGAERDYDSLARMDPPEWRALGFQGAAGIQWRSGLGEKAERSLWRAMGLDTKSPAAREALLLLAEVSLSRDTWNAVEAHLDSLVKTRPHEAEGHYWLGKMALKRQQDGVALEHFQRARTLAPKRPEFAAALAAAHFAREECDAALKTLKPLRATLTGEGLSIYGQCLSLQGRAKEAVQEFERLYAAGPTSQNLVLWARALSASGRVDRAISEIQASPFAAEPEARKALGAAQIELGAAEQARQTLEPLAKNLEKDAELHFLLGRAAFDLRDWQEAGRRFTSALQYREDYPEAKYRQGINLLKQGRSGEARHYFLELMDSDKKPWRAKGLLGQGQVFSKEEKPEAAAENFRKSFAVSASAEAAAQLALVLLRLDRKGEAAEWAAKARKLDADGPLALMASVDVLLAERREAEALALAQGGLDKHPQACEFLVVAAKAHLRAGHESEAKGLSEEARGRCPEESAPYYYLGTLSARAGTIAEARRHFGDYLRNGGDAKRVPEGYR